MTNRITIEMWSDLICPWCWIGKRRVEHAIAAFEHRDRVQLVHRAFRLMPGEAPKIAKDTLVQKLGSSQRVAQMLGHVEREAAKEGLEYHLAEGWTGDTTDLHRLVKLATAQGLGEQAVERLYSAVLTENETVFERGTQMRLMNEIGLAAGDVEAVLDSSAYADVIAQDQRALRAYGQSGVPLFVVDGKLVISGAQPVETFTHSLQEAWKAKPAEVAVGAVCGADGCLPQN